MIASGPKAWAIETDLWRMGNQCSVGRSFHCIRARGQAAKLRAVRFENWERPIAEEARLLEDWRQTASQEDRGFHWNKWYNSSFAKVLWENKCSMATKGIALETIKRKLNKGDDIEKERNRLRGCFQGEAARACLNTFLDSWESRVEHKLERWKIEGVRRKYRDIFICNLANLRTLVAPRVAAAVWGMA